MMVALLLLLLQCLLFHCQSEIISKSDEMEGAGLFRYHYSNGNNNNNCENLILLGVGTAMSISDYDMVSKEIIGSSYNNTVVMVLDPEPDWFIKTNAERFAKLANAIYDELGNRTASKISCCKEPPTLVLVGGHSAGGKAALESLPHLDFSTTTSGYLGLDPFEIDTNHDSHPLDHVPSLFWGFSKTTCGVDIEKAAKAGYESTSNKNHRVLYQIQNDNNNNTMIHHCIFTNYGCSCVCPKSLPIHKQEIILHWIGESTRKFLDALANPSIFTRANFELEKKNHEKSKNDPQVLLFVNDETVPDLHPQAPDMGVSE